MSAILRSEESTVVRKSQCPRCSAQGRDRSGDNLAEYSDGHFYCYSCHFYKPPNANTRNILSLRKAFESVAENQAAKRLTLPSDRSIHFPLVPGSWLSGYDITKDECLIHDITWSESLQGIVFPFYTTDEKKQVWVQGYQVRNFVKGRPKYTTMGPKDDIYWWQGRQHAAKRGIILVEDCVSALKLGRQACALPLLGSSLPRRKQIDLYKTSDKLFFWLDEDMAATSYKYAEQCAAQGYETQVIVTPEDPKWYDDSDITEILTGAGY